MNKHLSKIYLWYNHTQLSKADQIYMSLSLRTLNSVVRKAVTVKNRIDRHPCAGSNHASFELMWYTVNKE